MKGKQGQGYGLVAVGGEDIDKKAGGGEEAKEKEEEEERVKGCGLSPGGSPSHPPFPLRSISPFYPTPPPVACLYTMAASLLKFHVIGSQAWSFVLPQYPGSGACCRGDTLCKLKAGKPFLLSLASKKGRKSPHINLLFFHYPFSSPFLPYIKTEGRLSNSVKLHEATLV